MPSVRCPKCAKKLFAPDELAGRKVKCPRCQHAFQITPHSDEVDTVAFVLPPEEESAAAPEHMRSLSFSVEPWRAAIYDAVSVERFNGDFSEFAKAACDALAQGMGRNVKPPSAGQ